jgi:hypothetical protein
MTLLAVLTGIGCAAWVGWAAGHRHVQRIRDEAYVDGVLDRDRDLRPDAGTGGAQPLDPDVLDAATSVNG